MEGKLQGNKSDTNHSVPEVQKKYWKVKKSDAFELWLFHVDALNPW